MGAFVSYSTSLWQPPAAVRLPIEWQVHALEFLWTPGFELVGIVEQNTTAQAPVERTLRQYNLTGGLIDATDREGLETLDVILLGTNFVISRAIIHAINQAVRSGVGFLKEWWLDAAQKDRTWSDPEAAELLLAEPPVHNFHLAHCGIHVPAIVQEEHPLLPNLRSGSQVLVEGCGPVYRPKSGARSLINKNFIVRPEQHKIAGLGPVTPSAYLVGELGKGRVVVVQSLAHGRLWTQLIGGPTYLPNLLQWLAAPHRDA